MKTSDTSKILKRNCALCEAEIVVTVQPDGAYDNGHYFGGKEKDMEYWECDGCYREALEEARQGGEL
jgi:hypothetical protein